MTNTEQILMSFMVFTAKVVTAIAWTLFCFVGWFLNRREF